MSRSTTVKVVLGSLILVAIVVGFALPMAFTSGSSEEGKMPIPGVKLGLTAAAQEGLQGGEAFPRAQAGFSVYYQVTGGLDKAAVDTKIFNDLTPTPRRAGICTPDKMGENYTIGNCPIINIAGLITTVHVYYDTQGWVVGYLLNTEQSCRAAQFRSLNDEDPVLTDISTTTLLDALNEVLIAAGKGPIPPENAGYYHWGFPNASHFLLFGTARGVVGSDRVSFVLPVNVTPLDATICQWISKNKPGTYDASPCARVVLDGNNVTGDQCNRQFTHHSVAPPSTGAVHAMIHDFYQSHRNTHGASGATFMLIYSTP